VCGGVWVYWQETLFGSWIFFLKTWPSPISSLVRSPSRTCSLVLSLCRSGSQSSVTAWSRSSYKRCEKEIPRRNFPPEKKHFSSIKKCPYLFKKTALRPPSDTNPPHLLTLVQNALPLKFQGEDSSIFEMPFPWNVKEKAFQDVWKRRRVLYTTYVALKGGARIVLCSICSALYDMQCLYNSTAYPVLCTPSSPLYNIECCTRHVEPSKVEAK